MNDAITTMLDNHKWHTIETAPKDKRILIKTPLGDVFAATWVLNFISGDEAWAIANIANDAGIMEDVIVRNPTHWTHIPDDHLACSHDVAIDALQRIYRGEPNAGFIAGSALLHIEKMARAESAGDPETEHPC